MPLCYAGYDSPTRVGVRSEMSQSSGALGTKQRPCRDFGGLLVLLTPGCCSVLCVCLVASDSVPPWTTDCQAPPPMEFPRQEYWSGLPFPSPFDHWEWTSIPGSGVEEFSVFSETTVTFTLLGHKEAKLGHPKGGTPCQV